MRVALLLLVACGAEEGPPPWTPPEGGEITLETRDEITLAADYWPAETQEPGAVVLIHMHPPGGWNRTNWTTALVDRYVAAGLTVLAIDRRGAGESEGSPDDAWNGEWGRYDVEAAVARVVADGYAQVQLV